MVTLGVLVTTPEQEEDYLTAMAKASYVENVTVYLFSPNQVDIKSRSVSGKSYSTQLNKWLDTTFPLPTYIYDRCFYENETTFKSFFPFVTWLKNEPGISFLGHGLPNKWAVYESLKDDPVINLFLPETVLLASAKNLLALFSKETALLLKPLNGSQGRGIITLTKINNEFHLSAKKDGKLIKKIITEKQVEKLVTKLLAKRKYLIQPFLQLTDHDQRPFDIRVFLQKKKDGQWGEVGRGIRIGKSGEFTSNLGSGGTVSSFEEWLYYLPKEAQQPLENHLFDLKYRIPTILEKQGYDLFELGLDFGFDNEGKLWLLEVNSKPGRKVVTTSFPERKELLVKAPLHYCNYLESQKVIR